MYLQLTRLWAPRLNRILPFQQFWRHQVAGIFSGTFSEGMSHAFNF